MAGSTSVNIPVEVLGDDIAEATESFTAAIIIDNANAQQVTIGTGSATGTINDDDAYTISLAGFTVSETDANVDHNFVATMSGEAQEDVVISFTTTNGSAAGSDFTSQTSQTYTILAGSTSINIPVEVLGDDIAEATESFTAAIIIDNANAQQVTIGTGSATGTINDDDAYTISLAGFTVSEIDTNADHNFVATMSGEAQEDVVISFTTTNGTATAIDFAAQASQTYTILKGTTSVDIPVVVIGDFILESTESFTAEIEINDANEQQITIENENAIATGTINDNDVSEISIAANDDEAGEPNNDGQFTVSLSNQSDDATVIAYTIGGSATAVEDYTTLTGSITIPANTSNGTIDVSVIDNNILESDETVIVTLTSITSGDPQAIIGASSSATVTISDDDSSEVSITANDDEAGEPNNDGQFAVSLSNQSDDATVIAYTIGGSATAVEDYTTLTGSITIPANTSNGTIDVSVIDNNILESDETVIVNLTSITSGDPQTIIGASSSATVTISDDDSSEVSIAVTTSASEPGTNGLFTVTLTNPVDIDTEITFGVSGTATEGTDYSNLVKTLTIPANSTETSINIDVINDELVETGGEEVVVTLSGTNNAVTLSASKSANMNLGDDDSTEVSITATDDSSQEGTPSGNNAEFTISLTKASAVATVVSYNVSGTATQGDDYTSLSGTVTIPASSKSATIDVLVIDDVLFEDSETVILTLTGITSGDATTVLGSQVTATATIIDNDIECSAGDDLEICSSEVEVTLSTATQNNASNYTWTTNGSGTFTDASVLNAVYNPSDDDRTSGEVQLTLSVSGISGTDSDVMTLKIWPRVLLNAGDETAIINEGETYQVSGAVAVNHAGILWTSTGGTFDDPTALNPVFTPTTNENVVLRMTGTGLGTGACSDDFDEISLTINDFPIADNESVTGLEDQVLNFIESDFSTNYLDAESDAFAGIKIVSIESVGELEYEGTSVNSGLEITNANISKLSFKAQLNENGTNYDSFEFKVFDGVEYSSETYTMNISITAVNDEPSFSLMNPKDILVSEDIGDVIVNGQVATQSSGPADESGQILTLHLSNDTPALFSVQPALDASGNLTFTPAENMFGEATVSVYITDDGGVANGGDDTSAVQEFTITLEAVNDGPVAEDDLFTMDEDTQLRGNVQADNGNGEDSDPDNSTDNFTYTLVDGGTAESNGNLVFNADGSFTYDPNPDFFGEVSFTYQLCDNPVTPLIQKCNEATVTITVTQISDTPIAVDDNLWLKEDSSISGNVFDNDERLVDIPVVISSNTNPSHGTLSINPDGTFTYIPNKGYFGNDSFEYTLKDIDGDESTATVYIAVDPLDYDPIANDDFDTINEEEVSTGNLFANDEDFINDPVVVVSNTDPSNGTVVVNPDGTYIYTPNVDFYGTDTFTYTLEDSDGDRDSATVTITVNPVNDVPVAVDDTNTTTEDTEIGGNVLANDTNLGDAPVSVVDFTNPNNGTVLVVGDGNYTYLPDDNFNGVDSFTYTIEDENGDRSTAIVTITVSPINDVPVAVDDTNSTDEKSSVSGNVLSNDTDLDLDDLTVVEINGEATQIGTEIILSAGGTVRLNTNGTYEFNPNGEFDYLHTGETTQVTFTYSITDGIANSNSATVTITIVGINDAPVANDDLLDTYDNEEIIISVLDNDVDADGDQLSVDIIDEPKYGDVVVNADGSLSYIADLGSYCNTEQFTYRICDPAGLCDVATVTIEIEAKDTDEDSIPDAIETLTLNTDGDVDLNYQDLDSDNDGISDEDEAQITNPCTDSPVDTDGDGTPDYLDTDSDNDGYPDEEESDDDCDGDGIANYIDEYDDCAEYVSIPEGFSPNGDGINDKFVIKGIKDFPNSKLIIFNRWGNEIFKASGYQNDWDGRAKNSLTVGTKIVPEGTYYYVIDLGNGSKVIKGYVYINY